MLSDCLRAELGELSTSVGNCLAQTVGSGRRLRRHKLDDRHRSSGQGEGIGSVPGSGGTFHGAQCVSGGVTQFQRFRLRVDLVVTIKCKVRIRSRYRTA